MDLAINGLPPEFQRLRERGIYRVACHRLSDAQALCRQVLAAMAPDTSCALICAGLDVGTLLEPLDATAGPGLLRTFLLPADDMARFLPVFDDELARVWRGDGPELVVLLAPEAATATFADAALARVLGHLRAGAHERGGRLLWITHGESATLAPRLLPFCDLLSGFAQIYPDQGALRHHIHYWATEFGVQAAREFVMTETAAGWQVEAASMRAPFTEAAGDMFLDLVQDEVLEGAPTLSPQWRVFPDWSALMAATDAGGRTFRLPG